MKHQRICGFFLLLAGCAGPKAGTHVEVVDKGGEKVYVAGAAAPGVNKSIACGGAVQRAAAAIALKFTQEYDDLEDDIEEAVGVSDGKALLHRFAKTQSASAAVQQVQFDPVEHLCMATVRWSVPLFAKEAVVAFATQLKSEQVGQHAGSAAPSEGEAAPEPSTVSSPAAPVQGPPPVRQRKKSQSAQSKPAVCQAEKANLASVLRKSQKARDDFEECKRRTQGDATICHRYKLYVDEAAQDEGAAGEALVKCLNASLSTRLWQAIAEAAPGHAATAVETLDDGSLALWAYSPLTQTGFEVVVAADGGVVAKTALDATQLAWVRQYFGL